MSENALSASEIAHLRATLARYGPGNSEPSILRLALRLLDEMVRARAWSTIDNVRMHDMRHMSLILPGECCDRLVDHAIDRGVSPSDVIEKLLHCLDRERDPS